MRCLYTAPSLSALYYLTPFPLLFPNPFLLLLIRLFLLLPEQRDKPAGSGPDRGGVEQRADLGHHGGDLMDPPAQHTAVQRGTLPLSLPLSGSDNSQHKVLSAALQVQEESGQSDE